MISNHTANSDPSNIEDQKTSESDNPSQKSPEKSDSSKEYKSHQSDLNESDSTDPPKAELAYYIFSMLKQKNLNITLVGYFSRVLNHLILKKQSDVIFPITLPKFTLAIGIFILKS